MSRVPYYLLVVGFGLMTLGGFALAAPSPAELGWIEHEMTCAEWLDASEPITGSVRLTECTLAPSVDGGEPGDDALRLAQLTAARDLGPMGVDGDGGVNEAAARLWPARVEPGFDGSSQRGLVLVTHDDELRRLADTFSNGEERGRSGDGSDMQWLPSYDDQLVPGPRARFRQRHRDELQRTRTFEGVIEPDWGSDHASLVDALASELSPTFVIAPAVADRTLRAPGIVLATFGGLALLLIVLAQRRWTRRREELTGAGGRPLTF